MRYVRRDAVTPPPEWIGAAAAEVDEAGAYYSTGTVIRPFKFLPTRPILPTLRDLFAGKCAFCESDVAAVGSMTVSRFRPAATVVGHDGKIVTPGYWWLASDWTNLYLSCQICDRNKGARFPLVGTRARKPGDESAEAPICSTHVATRPTTSSSAASMDSSPADRPIQAQPSRAPTRPWTVGRPRSTSSA